MRAGIALATGLAGGIAATCAGILWVPGISTLLSGDATRHLIGVGAVIAVAVPGVAGVIGSVLAEAGQWHRAARCWWWGALAAVPGVIVAIWLGAWIAWFPLIALLPALLLGAGSWMARSIPAGT